MGVILFFLISTAHVLQLDHHLFSRYQMQ